MRGCAVSGCSTCPFVSWGTAAGMGCPAPVCKAPAPQRPDLSRIAPFGENGMGQLPPSFRPNGCPLPIVVGVL